MKKIGRNVFFGTKSLSQITLPYCIEVLEDNAFCWSGIKEIKLNEGLIEIGESAISYCKNLTHITIPKSVKKVGRQAFYNDEKLESVTWLGKPHVVTSAFKNTSLKLYYGPNGQVVPCEDTEKYKRPSFLSPK